MLVQRIQVNIGLPPPKTPRSPGIHVSNIIRCIATEQGILKAEWAEDLQLTDVREITDPLALLRINIGLAWEEHYIPMLPGVVDHPGELKLDGIYMTHDGESVSFIQHSLEGPGMRLVVHEVKATYYSTNTISELTGQPCWAWLAQIKAYCKALGTRYAMIHVLFICGDYSRPIQPIMACWGLEFTQQEIDENWNLMRDYRDAKLGVVIREETDGAAQVIPTSWIPAP